MSQFSKGAWVRYSGPTKPFGERLGQVVGHYRTSEHHAGIVMVRFLTGGEYGCYPHFLTKVYKRTAAIEVARLALS